MSAGFEDMLNMFNLIAKRKPVRLDRLCRLWLLVLLLLPTAGCAISSDSGYWRKTFSFEQYAEDIFRRQNQITSRILMLSEDGVEVENMDDLLEAEQELEDACQLLNEYAVRERDGVAMGFLFKRKVQNSVEDCEDAIHDVESMLKDVST